MLVKKANITDEAFKNLKGINTLEMRYIYKITDKAFAYLEGIYMLQMENCINLELTDEAFKFLKGNTYI